MLRDGQLHLSGLALLAPLITPQNRDAVLRRATHQSKREIERLVVELSPRPDARSMMRKLPQTRRAEAGELQGIADGAPNAGLELVPGAALELVPGTVGGQALDLAPGRVGDTPEQIRGTAADMATELAPGTVGPQLPRSRPAVVEPLSPARYKIQFTASEELHSKLERLTALMRSEVPDGDLAAIVEQAVTEKLERLEAKRFAKSQAPRQTVAKTETSPATRHIPAAVRRAVHERDGGRCRFVDELGRRCSEQHRLEFHHRHPFGMGGDHSPDNLSLLCSTHNRHLAEHDYGPGVIGKRGSH
jgi:5-methylcytosine-specific restriction endonuclease McrA